MSSGTQQTASGNSPTGFERQVEPGAKLLEYLAMTDDQAEIALMNDRHLCLHSPFHEHSDLDVHGWHLRGSTTQSIPDDSADWTTQWPIRKMLRELHPTTWNEGTRKAIYGHTVRPYQALAVFCQF